MSFFNNTCSPSWRFRAGVGVGAAEVDDGGELVALDLVGPLEPELLEQRIGRLDRIGQTSDIHIHIPVVPGTPQELLARWYHEGRLTDDDLSRLGLKLAPLGTNKPAPGAAAAPPTAPIARP